MNLMDRIAQALAPPSPPDPEATASTPEAPEASESPTVAIRAGAVPLADPTPAQPSQASGTTAPIVATPAAQPAPATEGAARSAESAEGAIDPAAMAGAIASALAPALEAMTEEITALRGALADTRPRQGQAAPAAADPDAAPNAYQRAPAPATPASAQSQASRSSATPRAEGAEELDIQIQLGEGTDGLAAMFDGVQFDMKDPYNRVVLGAARSARNKDELLKTLRAAFANIPYDASVGVSGGRAPAALEV